MSTQGQIRQEIADNLSEIVQLKKRFNILHIHMHIHILNLPISACIILSCNHKLQGFEILWIESINIKSSDIDHFDLSYHPVPAIATAMGNIDNADEELISDIKLKDLQNSPDFVDREDYLKKLALYKQHYESLGIYIYFYISFNLFI